MHHYLDILINNPTLEIVAAVQGNNSYKLILLGEGGQIRASAQTTVNELNLKFQALPHLRLQKAQILKAIRRANATNLSNKESQLVQLLTSPELETYLLYNNTSYLARLSHNGTLYTDLPAQSHREPIYSLGLGFSTCHLMTAAYYYQLQLKYAGQPIGGRDLVILLKSLAANSVLRCQEGTIQINYKDTNINYPIPCSVLPLTHTRPILAFTSHGKLYSQSWEILRKLAYYSPII